MYESSELHWFRNVCDGPYTWRAVTALHGRGSGSGSGLASGQEMCTGTNHSMGIEAEAGVGAEDVDMVGSGSAKLRYTFAPGDPKP
jgi:hypothetical protein